MVRPEFMHGIPVCDTRSHGEDAVGLGSSRYDADMQFDLNDAIVHLRRTPMVLKHLLGTLPDEWVRSNYGPETFSPFDVVGHLIHGEKTDWIPRLRHILAQGDAKPFEPFDRYAQYKDSQGKSMADLLDEFSALRAASIVALESHDLKHADFARKGMHPALGPVTLGNLLATWVVHDLHHIAQCCKGMAYQYRDEVGAWRAYIGIIPAHEPPVASGQAFPLADLPCANEICSIPRKE